MTDSPRWRFWRRAQARPHVPDPLTPERAAELFQKAASCYLRAVDGNPGQGADAYLDDACRLFEQLGDFRQLALIHRRRGRFDLAADAYERANNWRDAAACYADGRRFDDAASAYERAGDALEAAWVWADGAHRFERARRLLRSIEDDGKTPQVEIDVVRARCDAGSGARAPAVRLLNRIIESLSSESSVIVTTRVLARCEVVAAAVGRPDLQQQILATAVARGIPRAEEHWDDWARRTLGESVLIVEASPSSTAETKTSD
jgi:tetratricopeptide (TPR) repeat protein